MSSLDQQKSPEENARAQKQLLNSPKTVGDRIEIDTDTEHIAGIIKEVRGDVFSIDTNDEKEVFIFSGEIPKSFIGPPAPAPVPRDQSFVFDIRDEKGNLVQALKQSGKLLLVFTKSQS